MFIDFIYLSICHIFSPWLVIVFSCKSKREKKDKYIFGSLILGLNTFFVLTFVVFVEDGPHFYQMFKMVFIFVIRV